MQLRNIPLDDLKVSRLNMRTGRKSPDISDILPSIRENGVRQSLLVRREGDKYGVIAGRRRLFALRKVAKETGRNLKAPCGILASDDDAEAIEASLLENIARLPASEFQQYDAFAALVGAGKSVADIAATFGVTERYVKRILALSALKSDIKTLYEADEIDARTLRALTLASEEQQTDWLKLFHDDDEYEPRGERLKAWLTGGARILTKSALFDLETYGGVILTDLFSEDGLFADPGDFWSAQNAAIAAQIDQYRNKGWKDVVLLERGEAFHSWEHARFQKEKGGHVFVEVRHDGSVAFHEGYRTKADARRIAAVTNGAGDDAEHSTSPKPEMSGPVAEYIGLHRHAAMRAELTRHPQIALRFAVAHLIVGSALWRVDVENQHSRKEATAASVAASEGERLFAVARAEACALLGVEEGSRGLVRRNGDEWMLAKLFKRLLQLDDAAVLSILAVAMGETLLAGTSLVETLGHAISIDLAAFWKPDDAFFDLIRDKRVINAMVAEIVGASLAKAALTDTGKAQKTIIRNRIDGNGCEANPVWRPRWMETPARSYLNDEGCEPARHGSSIRAVMTGSD